MTVSQDSNTHMSLPCEADPLGSLEPEDETDHVDLLDAITSVQPPVTSSKVANLMEGIHLQPVRQPFLRFLWTNQVFQFRVLPFGRALAPLIFT